MLKQGIIGAGLGMSYSRFSEWVANVGAKPKFTVEELPAQTQRLYQIWKENPRSLLLKTCVLGPLLEEALFRGAGTQAMRGWQHALGFNPDSTQSRLVRGGVLTAAFAAVHINPSEGQPLPFTPGFSGPIKRSLWGVIKVNKRILIVSGVFGAVAQAQTELAGGNFFGPLVAHGLHNFESYRKVVRGFKSL